KGQLATQWLDELQDENGDALLRLPSPTGDDALGAVELRGAATSVAARMLAIDLAGAGGDVANDTTQRLTWQRPAREASSLPRAGYWIAPSRAAECWPELAALRVDELVRIGPPLDVRRGDDVDWAAFGDTVHAFLAADRRDDERSARRARARRLVAACDSGARM